MIIILMLKHTKGSNVIRRHGNIIAFVKGLFLLEKGKLSSLNITWHEMKVLQYRDKHIYPLLCKL